MHAMERCDFLVVGAGMAGASAAFWLAERGRVVVLEQEDVPGYHSTGRSAAMYMQTYGGPLTKGLAVTGRSFLTDPPSGFAASPLLSSREVLYVGRADQIDMLDRFYEENRRRVPTLARLDANQALEQPVPLREDYVAGAVLEPEAEEIDVAALHQGFLRGLRARGGTLMTEAAVTAFARARGLWHAETPAGAYCAPVVVNAAGAWCDAVAACAGVAPIGLQPKRRTAFIFDGPADGSVDGWPMVHDIDDAFYLKPDAGRILGSPADETPSEPCDVYPEELDIAIGADRIMQATTLDIRHIRNKWAGLRSFVRDRQPVAGFDIAAEGFFWLAGQGGAGIMTAPALGAVTAALVTGEPLPEAVAAHGIAAERLGPGRLRR